MNPTDEAGGIALPLHPSHYAAALFLLVWLGNVNELVVFLSFSRVRLGRIGIISLSWAGAGIFLGFLKFEIPQDIIGPVLGCAISELTEIEQSSLMSSAGNTLPATASNIIR